MLRLIDIKKEYKVGDSVVNALKGVTLSFRRNEFVSILGASGCGKTTLLNIIGGLDKYTSGDLIIEGKSTKDYKDNDWDTYRNHRIGFVFQSYNLIPHQSVLSNVELALTLSGVGAKERKARAMEALERVGLKDEVNKRPNQLSGGQMQRVAIARALVNNPEILLADEPTGALDTNTSIQIMNLVKEIAGERLVIMVTHNPEIAYKYSTRIVELKDGLVINDSAPYSAEDEQADVRAHLNKKQMIKAEEKAEIEQQKAEKKAGILTEKPVRRKKKTSMSFFTALALSSKSMLTRKGRTIVTSVAGSIGIISVCLVLALSNGFSNYITQTEEDMLSYYPISVSETSLDLTSAMANFSSGTSLELDNVDNKVYVNSFLSSLAKGMTTTNDLSSDNVAMIDGNEISYLEYIEDMPADLYGAISYGYGVSISSNLFTTVEVGSSSTSSTENENQLKTGAYDMSLSTLRDYYTYLLMNMASQYSSLTGYVDYFTNVVSVMPGTQIGSSDYGEYVLSQYDVVSGDFPQNSDEVVLVVGDSNDVLDLTLVQLGFLTETEFLELFLSSQSGDDSIMEIDFETVLNKTYTLYYNDSVFLQSEDNTFTYNGIKEHVANNADEAGEDNGDGITLKISGILRLKEGLSYGCLDSGLYFTESLVKEYIQQNMESAIVRMLNDDSAQDSVKVSNINEPSNIIEAWTIYEMWNSFGSVYTGSSTRYDLTSATISDIIHDLGGSDQPSSIYIYAQDFDTKDDILQYLDKWNDYVSEARSVYEVSAAAYEDFLEKGTDSDYSNADGEYTGPTDYLSPEYDEDKGEYTYEYSGPTEITYTDTVGTLMSLVNTILNAVTYVLVAFTAISLVVSTVMIGVITYVSVVERTKEIGILRSIGARKKDIRNVFNAETFIIGLCAGLIGMIVAYIIQVIINLILTPLTGISGLAALPFVQAIIMVCISIVLTLISGLIPASSAANKDPVTALRTE